MKLELQLLGPFAVVYGDQPLDKFRSNKSRALLAYLVTEDAFAETGRPPAHPRDQLMALLWPRTPQQSAQVNLRQTLYQLRKAIPELPSHDGNRVPFLLSDRQTVYVNPKARYHLDVARFLRLLGVKPFPDELAEAVSLYRVPFLSNFHLPDSKTFEEWAAGRRATLQRMALEALEALTAHHLECANNEEAERYARRQLALDNLRERAHRQLMRALAQQGRRNTALAHYEEYRALLAAELSVEPSVESEALYASLREGEVGAALAPVARAEPDAREKRRLPSPVTPFVGRQREMAQVNGMLENVCRLLTLLGPGGSGKTRLAIEVARRRAGEYTHGAVFVELAPLSDPANIPTAIAAALDFHFTSAGTPRDQILNYLANKDLLLVLDNVEHLLGGADLVADLLHTAPGVSVMTTSRARLNIGSECLFEVGGLNLSQEGETEAVEMFMEYARRVRPGFEVEGDDKAAVARICRLVQGMPLAIELAASWVRYLSPAGIVRELDEDLDFLASSRPDLPARQRSMRAAFDHSWASLDESRRDALMKLSVFRGGASRRAAKAVTGASLQALAALADHALLTLDPDSGRFAVHELIRQFALEWLEEAGEADAVRDAHSAFYLQTLAERLPDLKGRDQLGALDAIERDFENVRAAWRWAVRQRRWQHLSQASQTLYLFALFRSRYFDGIELFETARQAVTPFAAAREQLVGAYALAGELGLLNAWGSHEEALAAVPELRAAVETLDDPATVAYSLLMMGQILNYDVAWGEFPAEATALLDAARAYYHQVQDSFYGLMAIWGLVYARARARQLEQVLDLNRHGLALAREVGDRFVAAGLLHIMGTTTWDLEGPTETAESYFRAATNLHHETGARANYGKSLAHLGFLPVWREGDLAKGRPMLEEALAIAVKQNDSNERAHRLTLLATHRLLAGEYGKVLTLTEEALPLAERNTWGWCWATFQRGVASFALGNLDAALPFLKRALSRLNDLSYPGWLDTFLAFCSAIIARQGEHEWAAELLAIGLTGHHRGGLAIDPLLERTRAELEESLGQEAFAAAWERGKNLDPLAAAEDVLAALESLEATA